MAETAHPAFQQYTLSGWTAQSELCAGRIRKLTKQMTYISLYYRARMHTWLAYDAPLVLISDNDISLHTKAEIPR